MHELNALIDPLLALCRAAGNAICEYYQAPGAQAFDTKGDDTPLTQADLAAHRILVEGLSALSPVLPVLSEESGEAEMAARREWSRYWLVDPLDGTKEFLARTGEFTINIALVHNHRPVLGLIYLPLDRRAYVGLPGHAALRYDAADETGWKSTPITSRPLDGGAPMVVLASRRHRGQRLGELLSFLEARHGPLERRNSGSALKFCQLAEGEGDVYPRFSRCCEWDTAAGQAVVEAAGGCVLGLDGEPLRYNCSDSLYSPNFVAIADPGHGLWGDLMAALGAP